MARFIKNQPRSGETVMHCGHLDRGDLHWFQYGRPIEFSRPDGSRGEASWFAACSSCYAEHAEDAPKFVRGDGRWTGDAPVIQEAEDQT